MKSLAVFSSQIYKRSILFKDLKMQNLNLPTDNIFKFYALFGLMLIITSAFAFVNLINDTSSKNHELAIKVMEIEAKSNKSELENVLVDFYKQQGNTAVKNLDYYLKWVTYSMLIGIVLSIYGTFVWHFKVQRVDDEIRELQKELLRSQWKSND